jgi:hypothetical protein
VTFARPELHRFGRALLFRRGHRAPGFFIVFIVLGIVFHCFPLLLRRRRFARLCNALHCRWRRFSIADRLYFIFAMAEPHDGRLPTLKPQPQPVVGLEFVLRESENGCINFNVARYDRIDGQVTSVVSQVITAI